MSEEENQPGEGKNSSKEEDDLVTRSTKKVKTKEDDGQPELVSMVVETPLDVNAGERMEAVLNDNAMDVLQKAEGEGAKLSYRDKLLNIDPAEEEEIILDALKEMGDMDWSTNRKVCTEEGGEKLFDPCPSINISLEEAEEWCRPWKQALIVQLVAKKIGLKTITARLEKN